MYVLPLSIIAFSYQRIGEKVSKRLKELQYEAPNPCLGSPLSSSMLNAKTILHQTRKTQRILKPLVILFALTMLPYQMFNLATVYWGETYRIRLPELLQHSPRSCRHNGWDQFGCGSAGLLCGEQRFSPGNQNCFSLLLPSPFKKVDSKKFSRCQQQPKQRHYD